MNSPKVSDKLPSRNQGARRQTKILSPSESQEQIANEESSSAQLERVKGERVSGATKQDEDRRRRTIIVEKKNGSFGFTLQSYGIHYKKEQEIEMITYVDYVEYDGPAFKAGMREGDVILSINGQDMEKADHKALVNFIKNCDTRMRMVVLFEDCVRKVELHIRYIQLQRILQSKTAELDKLCLKEREVLQGKWKSHSLPARKKTTPSDPMNPTQEDLCCRPTASTESMARIPNQSQIVLAYQCLDSRYPCVLQSDNSNECLVGWSREAEETRPILVKKNCDHTKKRCSAKGYHQTKGAVSADAMKSRNPDKAKHRQDYTRHLCNPCMQAINNQDNNSLEAYDLASPCCHPHCVPSSKRKSKSKHKHQTKNVHEQETCKENVKCRSAKGNLRDCGGDGPHKSNQHRSHVYLSSLVSQFSLHSCTSSDVSHGAGENSGISYTTSLSSDTLYWDGNDNRTTSKPHSCSRTSSCKSHSSSCDNQSFQPVKPKSWDNLTTKAFGGYGFGYGYMDTSLSHKNHSNSSAAYNASCNTMPAKVKNYTKTNGFINLNQINFKSKAGGRIHSIQIYHNGHRHCERPTKSSENLLLKKPNSILTNSSHSCECLEIGSPLPENAKQFFPSQQGEVLYYHQNAGGQTDVKNRRTGGKPLGNVSRL